MMATVRMKAGQRAGRLLLAALCAALSLALARPGLSHDPETFLKGGERINKGFTNGGRVEAKRAANTGISAIIDADGDIVQRLDIGQTGVIDAPLPGARSETPYGRAGDWTLLALVTLCWAAVWIGVRSRGRSRGMA